MVSLLVSWEKGQEDMLLNIFLSLLLPLLLAPRQQEGHTVGQYPVCQ